jgi:NADH-quinone oxidoreductase subunit H
MKYIIIILQTLLLVIFILITVALFTLFERKIMAAIQKRKGPNVVGFFGILQPFADGLKLLIKETIMPSRANKILFIIAPIISLFLSLVSWAVIPFDNYSVFANLNFGVLYIFAVSSLNVYSIIFAGWSGNSKYSFLGTLRFAAQMISYEVSIGLIIICILLCSNSLNLLKIIQTQIFIWYIIPLFPLFLLFYISALAETNRPPFDLPEAEAELVAGYFVEYSAMTFAQFFLGENINIIMVCTLIVIFFLGGWNFSYTIIQEKHNIIFLKLFFVLKIIFFLFTFVWVRVTFPRYRYDQLMRLGWKIFLPLTLALVLFISSCLLSFNLLI